MIDTNGERLFSLNCGIKIFGGWSRANPQKSLSVFFRKEYGDPVLKGVQLFEAKPIDEFKSFVLRNSGNDHFNSKFRDGMMTSLTTGLNTDFAAFQPVAMYLNGEYWRIINLREKLNEDFLESNFDVPANEIDLLEYDAVVNEGSNEHYLKMLDLIKNNDIADDAIYEEVLR